MDSASDYGSEGWGFESLRGHFKIKGLQLNIAVALFHLHKICTMKCFNFNQIKIDFQIKIFRCGPHVSLI